MAPRTTGVAIRIRRDTTLLSWCAFLMVALAVLALVLFTVEQIPRAATRVPWQDEWAMVEEYSSVARGHSLLDTLWSPYWGHRLVLPRLIAFANIRWAGGRSLTWLIMIIHSTHIVLLIFLTWWLCKGAKTLRPFGFAVTAIVAFMLSPSQMENFVWSMQLMFPLVYLTGSAAFLLIAMAGGERSYRLAIMGVVFALAASLTMSNGLLVWPVLLVESLWLATWRRCSVALAIIGFFTIACYCWHYQRPALGLGVSGVVLHPVKAISVLGLLLGAPVGSSQSGIRTAVGLLGIVCMVYLCARISQSTVDRKSGIAVVSIAAFLILSAALTVVGRLDKVLLDRWHDVPSKYFTLVCTFWAVVAILSATAWCHRILSPVAIGVPVSLICLLFIHPTRLLVAAEDWADFFRGADAVGSALLLNVNDTQLLPRLLDPPQAISDNTAFMRKGRFGIFAEARASWPGNLVSRALGSRREVDCAGAVEFLDPVLPADSWRVEGWATTKQDQGAVEDLVITDRSGLVTGLGRGGLRHRYIPGFFTDANSAVRHGGSRRSEWLGYILGPGKKPWTVYGIAGHRFCRVTSIQ
jgi:hypothetical protein